MTDLIKSEGLKIRKSLGFWVLCLCSAGLSLLVIIMVKLFQSGILPTGVMSFNMAITQSAQMNTILVSVFAAIFICNEFVNRTFGMSLFSGFTRGRLMAAKVITLIIGTVILTAITPVMTFVAFTVMGGFGGGVSELVGPMLQEFGLYMLGNVTLAGFSVLLAYTIRNVGGTIGAGIGINMALGIAAMIPFSKFQQVMKFSFVTQQSLVGTERLNIPFYISVMLVTLAAEIIVTVIILNKSDLK